MHGVRGWAGSREKGRGRERSRSPPRNMSTEEPGQGLASKTQPDKNELQYQFFRLKRKLDEVKKRHRQDKDIWVKEKEMLLREVAEIQAGENRRILLDLRSILESVQVKVKKEEDQRAELQHQYSSDKYVWELERAELKCRIGQLELKASKQCVEKTPQEASETFGKEREEQKQLLANIHSAAMDLRKQLEISERNWGREKMELLEQFDNERKEWESQLKDMQRKIEQIYWDVNSRQECKLNGQRQRQNTRDDWVLLNLHTSSPECNEAQDQNCMNSTKTYGAGMEDVILNDTDQGIGKSASDSLFIEELSLESLEEGDGSQNMGNVQNDKKKFASALNAALQEIAKVSEELCSYQEDVQKKVSHRRTKSVSHRQECKEKQNENTLLRDESFSDEDSCISNDIFKALSPTLSEYQKCSKELHNEKNWNHSKGDGHGISPAKSGGAGRNDTSSSGKKAPPVPPRTSSWYLANSFSMFPLDHEDAGKEGNSNCTTGNHVVNKSCNHPCVLRKYEASLQENEQKSLIGGRYFEPLTPQIKCDVRLQCNKNNNHSRWSCGFRTGNNYFDSAGKTFSSDKNIMLPTPEQRLDGNSNGGLRQRKPLSPKCNPTECNFPSSSSATGVCSTSGVFVQSELGVPSTQTGTFSRAGLNTERCAPAVYGKSVEMAQNETVTYPQPSFSLHSAGNVHDKQFSSQCSGSAFRPYVSPYVMNTKIAGQDKHSCGFPGWIAESDKSHIFDKVDLIPNNFSSPKLPSFARSNFDIVQTMLRNNERPASPSFHVEKKVANCADGRTKPQTSHSGSLHENANRITHLFRILHQDQDKQEIMKTSGLSRCVSGQQASLPVTLPPVTMRLNGMSFSRPATPQNRRLPSRWATRSSSASAVHNRAAQKHGQAFFFDIKTSII
ncbi:protein SOGA3a isoform X2 [Scyliorhinus torazame]|uniref:protein SOGA3a isoform X2 n=1 Tax=Scyliorhinus torazame TaxID=75743 RepID=UPI003B598321